MLSFVATTVTVKSEAASGTVIWVTAGAGVVGALVGGAVTGWLTLRGEHNRQAFAERMEKKRNEREDEQRAAAVRAAARVLLHRLRIACSTVEVAVESASWWPGGTTILLDLPSEEWRLLAASMEPERWNSVERAERRLRAHQQAREHFPDDGDDVVPLSADLRCDLSETLEILRTGIAALQSHDG